MNTKAVYQNQQSLIKRSKIGKNNVQYTSIADLFRSTYFMNASFDSGSTRINFIGYINLINSCNSKKSISEFNKLGLTDIIVTHSYDSTVEVFIQMIEDIVRSKHSDVIFNEFARSFKSINRLNDFVYAINEYNENYTKPVFLEKEISMLLNNAVKNLCSKEVEYKKFIFDMKLEHNIDLFNYV